MRQTVTENRLFSKKDLRKLIIPLILEQTLAITVGMADTMMISSAGEAAVSGVSLVDMFNNLIISVLAALATGGAVVTSQCIGAGRREEACRSARQLVFTEAAITIGISVLVLLFHRQILGLFFGQIEADVMQNAIIYLIISVFSFPLLAVYDSCAALYRSMGNAQITLKISLLMNVINVVGNAIGVYVLKLGVAGVAIPSLVSRGVAGVVLFTLLHNPDNLVFLTRGKFKVDATIVKRILFIGIPSGIENGIFQLTCACGQHHSCVRHQPDRGERGGEQSGFHGMYCGTGDEPCDDYCDRTLCGSRRRRTGALLHQKAAGRDLFLYGGHQQHHFTSAAVDFTDLWTGRGDDAPVLHSGHDS
mgnify:CR=1 FL=1